MNLILVCVGTFQEYILDNIEQLIRLHIDPIYVITNRGFFNRFHMYNGRIQLIDADELRDEYQFYTKTSLDKSFRDGFWALASMRFFYIYAAVKSLGLTDCIHIENDVLLFYPIEVLKHCFTRDKIYLPFDTFERNIASIMYIPNADIFKRVLDCYQMSKNDMENFAHIKRVTALIENFPIYPKEAASTVEEQFVSENYPEFGYLFDAAAIGQYIGGIDPRNSPGDTRGFVNETCVIKYNKHVIYAKDIDHMKKPFINIHGKEYPIFNLHIHSKKLRLFM
ncbi:MAG: hypothetical protein ACOVRN_07460 [Flavobacterium sp.]